MYWYQELKNHIRLSLPSFWNWQNTNTQNHFFTQLVFEQIFVMRANGRLFMTQVRLIFLKQRRTELIRISLSTYQSTHMISIFPRQVHFLDRKKKIKILRTFSSFVVVFASTFVTICVIWTYWQLNTNLVQFWFHLSTRLIVYCRKYLL